MYGLACTICIQSAICRPQQHTVWSQNIARKTLVMMHIQPFDFWMDNRYHRRHKKDTLVIDFEACFRPKKVRVFHSPLSVLFLAKSPHYIIQAV